MYLRLAPRARFCEIELVPTSPARFPRVEMISAPGGTSRRRVLHADTKLVLEPLDVLVAEHPPSTGIAVVGRVADDGVRSWPLEPQSVPAPDARSPRAADASLELELIYREPVTHPERHAGQLNCERVDFDARACS